MPAAGRLDFESVDDNATDVLSGTLMKGRGRQELVTCSVPSADHISNCASLAYLVKKRQGLLPLFSRNSPAEMA